MNNQRRNVLKTGSGAALLTVLAAAGIITPGMALADWNKAAFDAKSITMHDFFNLRNPFYGKDTAWGALAKDDRFIVTTIGRHPNDRMFSFYCKVPGGFELEYGCGGVRIEDDATWEQKRFDRISTWGHKDAMMPTLLKKVVKTMRRHGIGEM